MQIVLHDEGGLGEPDVQRRVTAMLGDVAKLPKVGQVRSPYQDKAAISEDRRIGYATVMLDVPAREMPKADTRRIFDMARKAAGGGLRVELGGDAARLLGQGGTGAAEGAGLLAALVVLVLMFGTVIAAGLPIVIALFAVGSTVAALTLLPALLGVFGRRFARQFTRRAERREAKGRAAPGAAWRRLAGTVQRRPPAALLAAGVLLGALAVPALGMRLGFSDAGSDPSGATSRKAYDLLSTGFGPGFNGPLLVVTDGGREGAQKAAAAAVLALYDTPGVEAAADPVPTPDGRAATILAFPSSAPQDEATTDLVGTLRDDVLPGLSAKNGARYLVGGATAASEDYSDKVAERLPLFMAIVVGLSMDYEIFLISRIHEEWTRSDDPSHAVREGLAHTGSVSTAAGAIMVVIFGAFMLSPDRLLQQTGFGMAVAIFTDAVIIRCLIVPAAMELMGRRAWWLPAPLARLLPRVALERR
ncbi:MMPL family transporter [Actinomadura decatromicini]|uniref:MMPL family transporter n=1 Tax=Actinomadura decatromicini TaxID=2604572 RepID=UPI001FE76638|nr:MMPL family transporter [Actinomadura decatromicini]